MESFLFVWVDSSKFGKLSSKDKHFVSLEITQRLSSYLICIGLSQTALSELLSYILLFKNGFDFSGFSASEDLHNLSGQLESSDRDNLSADCFTVNKNSFVIEDVNNGGKLACICSIINSRYSTDFYEFGIALNERMITMCLW